MDFLRLAGPRNVSDLNNDVLCLWVFVYGIYTHLSQEK